MSNFPCVLLRMCTGNFLVTVSHSFTQHYVATKALRHTLHETLRSVSARARLFLPLSAKSSSLAFLPSEVFGSLSWRLFPNMVKVRSFSETSEVSACRNAAELN